MSKSGDDRLTTAEFITCRKAEILLSRPKRDALAHDRVTALEAVQREMDTRLRELRPDDRVLHEWVSRNSKKLRLEILENALDPPSDENVVTLSKRKKRSTKKR